MLSKYLGDRAIDFSESPVFEAKTDFIEVSVTPLYLVEESDLDRPHHVWLYHVNIYNGRPNPVDVIGAYWKVTDSYGRVEEVRGTTVGGEQPTIAPFSEFEYASAIAMATPSGFMSGLYHVREQSSSKNQFEVRIPTISLDPPQNIRTFH